MRGGRDYETMTHKGGRGLARYRDNVAGSWPARQSNPDETALSSVLGRLILMPRTPKVYGVKSLLNSRAGYDARLLTTQRIEGACC